MLKIVVSYNRMQFERKLLMIQTQKNKKILEKLILGFGPDLGPLEPNSVHHLFFFSFFPKIWLHQSLVIIISYHRVQYQKKLMTQY